MFLVKGNDEFVTHCVDAEQFFLDNVHRVDDVVFACCTFEGELCQFMVDSIVKDEPKYYKSFVVLGLEASPFCRYRRSECIKIEGYLLLNLIWWLIAQALSKSFVAFSWMVHYQKDRLHDFLMS